MLLFLGFFVAFAIKVPLFPLHTWLPDAHVEAPVAGSVMLASVMLKMGTYGILHFCLPLFPSAARQSAGWIATLAIVGIIYGALVAMVQPNMKKLVAYSSVSHLGFVVLGIFSFTQQGLDGAVYQMLNHGISTGALFVFVGLLYERRHSLEIADYGGVATAAPWLSTAFLVTTLASIGLPTLNNFVGEFLVLQGAAIAHFTWAVWASLGVILSACYMLWLYQRVFYGVAGAEVRVARLGPARARVGGGDSAADPDGVDGRVLRELPAAGGQGDRPGAGAIGRERAVPGGGDGRGRRWRVPVDIVMTGFTSGDLVRFLPEIVLTAMGTLLMVLDPVLGKRRPAAFGHLSIAALVAGIAGAAAAYAHGGLAFGGMLRVDAFATFFRVLVMAVGILTVLPSYSFLKRQQAEAGEFHALLLFSIAGQCMMAAANDLIVIFHRPGDFLHRQLRAGRIPARRQAVERGRAEVFSAGFASPRRSSFTEWRWCTAAPAPST